MKRKTLTCAVLWLFLAVGLLEGKVDEDLSLSLEESILQALTNNLRVAVEVINPGLAETSLSRAREVFLPRFDLNYGVRSTKSPSYWFLEASETSITDFSDYSFAVVQRLAFGTSLSLSLTGYRSDTNQMFQLINPRYGSTIQINVSQPLLKDFGNVHAFRSTEEIYDDTDA